MADATDVPAGDASRHLSLEELEARLKAMPPAPRDEGRVVALFARPGSHRRLAHDRARLTVSGGMPEDRWAAMESPKSDQQLATMQSAVAELIANGQPISMFGDNLFLDLDLSSGNLPFGTRLKVGGAVLEVTPEPHNGCLQFKSRFGSDALRFVARKEDRDRNLRGIYLKVVEDGDVSTGDRVEVIRR